MSNQITGKLIQMPYPETGQGKNGEWIKQLFIIETDGQYPEQVALTVWKDTAKAIANVKVGSMLKVHFSPSSREFNGKWYTDLKAYKYEVLKAAEVDESTGEVYQAEVLPPDDNSSDLPF